MTDTAPIIEAVGVTKQYGAPMPLRVRRLALDIGERVALGGLDLAGAETLIHLITGASLPDEGTLRVAGQDTRDIATDTEWLQSLDRFGIVTRRAVLIESLPIDQNLALPISLSIDPMSLELRGAVEALADVVELPRARLGAQVSTLSADERARVHLARAVATGPLMLLLEHPTVGLDGPAAGSAFGRVLRQVADARRIGWLALTDDPDFVAASGARSCRMMAATGVIVNNNSWWRRLVR